MFVRDSPMQSKTIDPARVFASAEEYWALITTIAVPKIARAEFTLPCSVLSAFCLELYLKCLILLAGKTYKGVHDLRDLFDLLDPKDQEAIRETFDARGLQGMRAQVLELYSAMKKLNPDGAAVYDEILNHPEKIDFDFALDASSGTFAAVRYDYEGTKPGRQAPAWYGHQILEATRELIQKKKGSANRGWQKV
jgi:hypothetical protein